MRYAYWARTRIGRLLTVLLALLVYCLLLTVDGLRFFPQQIVDSSSLFTLWLRFGFSALAALLFLAVGTLVWLYARNRRVALFLFCFSCTMMITFAVETGAASNDSLLSVVGSISGVLSLSLFALLLLLFPKNYFSFGSSSHVVSGGELQSGQQYYSTLLLRGYVATLIFLSIIAELYSILRYLSPSQVPDWLDTVDSSYYVLALIGILITIIASYRRISSLRQRQQQRFFVSGVILAFVPLLLLTLLPLLLGFPEYSVDGQVTTITLGFLPLALGYTILRYQVLVFDMYIRRSVAWLIGSVGLVILGYGVFICGSLLFAHQPFAWVIFGLVAMGVLAPCVWILAKSITDRLFFTEMLHYQRLIEQPDALANETFDLNKASQLITLAAVNLFETQEVCLFVLDEDTGYYHPCPPLVEGENSHDEARCRLVQRLSQYTASAEAVQTGPSWIKGNAVIVRHVDSAPRPLLLSEAIRPDEELPRGLSRYLATTGPLDSRDPLLAPVRFQGKMIGMLVLGERGDHQQYAGPDFEALHLLFTRFSSVLQTACLYAQVNQHVTILDKLYSTNAVPIHDFETMDQAPMAYARIAADAVSCDASIWLYEEKEKRLRRFAFIGTGPRLVQQDVLTPSQEEDWLPWFYEGDSSQIWQGTSKGIPPCLPQASSFPFVWLPLNSGDQHLGLLILTYSRPHHFSREEQRVLGMFATQCVAALENVRMTLALRAAYERQKELDRLKDEFITTTSHELRTPLTAVQGYLELLASYHSTMEASMLDNFLAKASRGCEELALMVGNITDASRVQVDVKTMTLNVISLSESVQHVLEIIEAGARREQRTIQAAIPADLFVVADKIRLRQILLNLLSNALKYSPTGSDIEIAVDMNEEEVTLRVRDYGLGIPLAEQERLFERFVRLERDMNSPARGAGLGLYISKQLVEAMGGRIWVESTGMPDEGSTFIFTLQRSTAQKPALVS